MRNILTTVAVVLVASTACAQYKSNAPKTPPPASTGPKLMQPVVTPPEALESARRINRVDAAKMVSEGKAVFVDVRPKTEYDAGHIKGAINIPLAELQTRYGDLPMKKFLITYCA